MSEAEQCGATIGIYLDPKARAEVPLPGTWEVYTAENPARGLKFFAVCNYARDNGLTANVVIEGEHAEEAADRVRRLTEKPLEKPEVGRKTLLWASGRARGGAPKGRYERASVAATLPGELGLECIFYGYLSARTAGLRSRVYITVTAGGEEFRPTLGEHFPSIELSNYQMAAGARAFGKGRSLRAKFTCYAPHGSGAANQTAEEIRGALKKLAEVATWPERKRSWFGFRHSAQSSAAVLSGLADVPYRPPDGALADRPKAPRPTPPGPARPSFNGMVDDMLQSWGDKDAVREWRKMETARSSPEARARRRQKALERLNSGLPAGREVEAAWEASERKDAARRRRRLDAERFAYSDANVRIESAEAHVKALDREIRGLLEGTR